MDLNLVRVFVAIYETRSLTLASERLFVTQSAVSQALGRLRENLDDPLFERVGREMRPTPLAEVVSGSFREAISQVDGVLDSIHGFDAAGSERVFRLALSELGEIGWLPALFDAVHSDAPHVRIEVLPIDPETLPDWLTRGIVDLAITPAELPPGFERRRMTRQSYRVIMSTKHRWAARPMTLEMYRAASHAAVASDTGAALLTTAQERAGVMTSPLVTVQHFATLPKLVAASSELIATIPEAIAAGWAETWPIAIHELPFEMAPIELGLYRRRAVHHSAAIDWFYRTVARAIEGSAGEFSAIQVKSAD